MKTFLKIIGGIFAAIGAMFLVLFIIGLVVVMTEDDTASSGAPEGTSSVSQSSTAPEKPSVEPGGLLTDDQGRVYVGSTVEAGGFAITYEEFDDDWRDYHWTNAADDGNKYIRAYFTFENIDTVDHYCSSSDFDCYADGVACNMLYAGVASRDDTLYVGEVSPGRIGRGYIYFEVPVDAEEIELEYEVSRWTEEKIIFLGE